MIRSLFRRLGLGTSPAVMLAVAMAACGSAEKARANSGAPSRARTESLEHERCDVSSSHVETLDTNGDGKPDLRRVYDDSKHELCREVDLNHDGKPDLYEYFDSSGSIRRREFCYDDAGDVNAVELYEAGKLVQRQYDTTGQHRIDTWDWFDPKAPVDSKTGRPVHPIRRERDTKGIGFIDQWWTWNGTKVSIATDKNGDGKPDPGSLIVLGAGEDAGAAAAAGASVSSASPTADASPMTSADGGDR
jgi:hypothetical protein